MLINLSRHKQDGLRGALNLALPVARAALAALDQRVCVLAKLKQTSNLTALRLATLRLCLPHVTSVER